MATEPGADTLEEIDKAGSENGESGRASTPSSSHSSSLTNNERNRNDKPPNRHEVTEEDEIFFKDDHESSEAPPEGVEYGYYGPVPPEQQLSASRRKIIQDILASFNMEEVMNRYRGDSVNRSLSRQKFKTWLESVMAENKAQFSDRQWNEQFRQKVLHDFERKQDEREKKLADAESQRILKLKLLGIIRDEGEEARREELAMRKTSSEKKFHRRTTRKHQSLFQPNDIETQMEILNRDEGEIKARNRTQNEDGEGYDYNNENTEDQDDVDGRNMTYKSHLGRTKVDKKDEHPQLRQLYEEEDLRQLYRGAATLVKRTQRSK